MAYLYPLQPNFSRGELGPRLQGRADIEHYLAALKTCTNFTVLKQGGLRKRSGFQFVAQVKDHSKKVRLLPFIFSSTQAFALEIGDTYARPMTNGGRLVQTGQAITNITKANPAVLTYVGADTFANGDPVLISGVLGMTQVNNREFIVAGVNNGANTFQLSGVDSTGYDAYTSGGTVSEIVQFATPWLEAQLPLLDYTSSADVMTVCHKSHQPREIIRNSDTSWTVQNFAFDDGPYMSEPVKNHATLKFSGSGHLVPDMTSNVLPSGTAAATNILAGSAFNVFDRDVSTTLILGIITSGEQNVSYDLGAGVEKTPVGYALRMRGNSDRNGMKRWRLECQRDGSSAWVVMDSRVDVGGWGQREKKFFPLSNDIPFRKFRCVWQGISIDRGDDIDPEMCDFDISLKSTEQTPAACTATSTAGINGGAGFSANDVGRQIRVRGSDGLWRYFEVTSFSSSTVVNGVFHGCPMPDDDESTAVWQMGSWYGGNWPQHITNFGERRAFGGTDAEPQTVWLTKVGEIYDFGRSVPLVADDGITFTFTAKKISPITWMEEGDDLIVGTTGGVRVIGAASSAEGFSATSVKQRRNTAFASKPTKPTQVGSVVLYPDYFGKVVRELYYSFDVDAYVSPDLTILSDHFLKSGVVEVHYQQSPDSVVWIVNGDGELIALTYERDQRIAACTKVAVAGGDPGTLAVVESMCVIPGTTRDEVYIAVKRTIGGQTRRFIERQAGEFENMPLPDAVFLDSSYFYSGAATGTVSGLFNLEGQSVGILADGNVLTPQTVTNGKITLPGGVTAAKICVGKKYTALGRTLAVAQGRDGTQLGRRKLTGQVIFDVLESLGLKIRGVSGKNTYDVLRRDALDPGSGPMNLRTGRFNAPLDQSWRDDGEFEFLSDTPEPLTIRGVTPAYSSEGT